MQQNNPKIPSSINFDETVQDFEYATQKARLSHQIELKTRSMNTASNDEKRVIEQEVAELERAMKQLDEKKLSGIERL